MKNITCTCSSTRNTCEPVSDGKIDVGLTGVIMVKESVGCYVLFQDVKLFLVGMFHSFHEKVNHWKMTKKRWLINFLSVKSFEMTSFQLSTAQEKFLKNSWNNQTQPPHASTNMFTSISSHNNVESNKSHHAGFLWTNNQPEDERREIRCCASWKRQKYRKLLTKSLFILIYMLHLNFFLLLPLARTNVIITDLSSISLEMGCFFFERVSEKKAKSINVVPWEERVRTRKKKF